MKRLIDLFGSAFGLILFSPVLLVVMIAIWLQDYCSPFYIAPRVEKNGKIFRMVKLRSMVKDADKSGVDSSSANDLRITKVGKFIRRYKLDEFMQLWNVFKGDMSLVGPRPNVKREVDLYTEAEKHMLDVKPGITDFASIVFSDEAEILKGSMDPDLDYNKLIRPWKSRLGLLYVEKNNIILDFQLIFLTIIAIVDRKLALRGVVKLLELISAPEKVIEVSARKEELLPYPPPGSDIIVTAR
jgi:lipopolysaccharide/colanic/teichoic acid biosynthesis glycosyltransferase